MNGGLDNEGLDAEEANGAGDASTNEAEDAAAADSTAVSNGEGEEEAKERRTSEVSSPPSEVEPKPVEA